MSGAEKEDRAVKVEVTVREGAGAIGGRWSTAVLVSVGGGAVLVGLAIGLLIGWASGDDEPAGPPQLGVAPPMEPPSEPEPQSVPTSTPSPTVVPTATPLPTPLPCPLDGLRCIRIVGVSTERDAVVIDWEAVGFEPILEGGFHAHFFWDDFAPEQAGNNAASFGSTNGVWRAVDAQPYVFDPSDMPNDAERMCVTVGTPNHGADNPALFDCVEIPPVVGS